MPTPTYDLIEEKVLGSAQATVTFSSIPGTSSTTNYFGVGVTDILDYTSTSKYKTTRSLTGNDQNGSGYVWLFSSSWRNANAVTSIYLYGINNFAQFSTFSLYGCK